MRRLRKVYEYLFFFFFFHFLEPPSRPNGIMSGYQIFRRMVYSCPTRYELHFFNQSLYVCRVRVVYASVINSFN